MKSSQHYVKEQFTLLTLSSLARDARPIGYPNIVATCEKHLPLSIINHHTTPG